MEKKVDIIYREFYDIPRVIIAKYKKHVFLFESLFDEVADEYPDHYKVYLLSELSEEDLVGSWENLHQKAIFQLCIVPLQKLEFDKTKRKSINASLLDEIGKDFNLW